MSKQSLWTEVTTSEHDHERAALHFIRENLPDREPFRAWANFMFIAEDGTRNEVDLLVVSPTGVYLVEIKSYPGRIDGDAGTWKWTSPDGYRRTFDNPLLLAERKAKKLKSLLTHQQVFRTPRMRGESFYLKSCVFLSDPDLTVGLNQPGRTDVYGPDPEKSDGAQENVLPGILQLFCRVDPRRGPQIDRAMSKAIAEAMDQAGIREATTHRKVGGYELGELLDEGEGWQDFAAEHPKVEATHRRIRLYLTGRASTKEEREALHRAAEREFKFLQGIEHPGIDRPLDLLDTPRGPALIFDRRADAERLDHWLSDHADDLALLDRIELVRELGEVVRYAHRQDLFHRALAPQHIRVTTQDGRPELVVQDWQTAARRRDSSSGAESGTKHVVERVADAARVYLAPETLRLPDPEPAPADIWSLGAVAFLILSGEPPARDVDSLHELLREHGHLPLASAMDAPDQVLEQIIRHATEVDATDRFVSADEFLEYLDFALEELTSPEQKDPFDASRGDTVGDQWTIKRRLGTGSTSVVLLAETPDREEVLKVARNEEHGQRIRDEYEVLDGLRHRTIVEPYGLVQIAGRTVLRLEFALTTLSHQLRDEGPLSLDLLERFGNDLLDALVHLDEEGVAHRDIKPDNLGIAERGKDQERRLVLFDFSLARTDPGDLRVGTAGYLDPFLEERETPRWDPQAERYSAAVTLYEMATGTRPEWGDGSTDPLLTDLVLPEIDEKLFDPSVREDLTAFFEQALQRDPSERFDTASQMRRAWSDVFRRAEVEATDTQAVTSVEDLDLDGVTRETPIAELNLTPKVRNAIERLEVWKLGELADYPPSELVRLGGIGASTRREINQLARRLRERFETTGLETGTGLASVDRLAQNLVPGSRIEDAHRTAMTAFLGLGEFSNIKWPAHRDVVAQTGLDRSVIADALTSGRARWKRQPEITTVRGELVEQLAKRGGIGGGDELASVLLTERGSLAGEPLRSARARAVLRAAIEVEGMLETPRFLPRRVDGAYLVALDGEWGEEAGAATGSWNAARLADAAEELGAIAEIIVSRESLVPTDAVIEELRSIELPDAIRSLDDTRLVRLAAAACAEVAVSTRLELYPTGMPPARAIEESRPALLNLTGIRVDEVHQRVRARFPEAAELPRRPKLDKLLEPIGLEWSHDEEVYQVQQRGGVLSTLGSSGPKTTSFESVDARDAAVRRIDDRLREFSNSGGFLALTVNRRRFQQAVPILAQYVDAELARLDDLLLQEMHAIVDSAQNAQWERFLKADNEKGDRGWTILQQVVDRAIPKVESRLKESDGLLAITSLGLLARYDRFDLLERFRDLLTRTRDEHPLQGLLLVIPGDDPSARPVVDGHPIPVITANQWAHLPSAWLESHREGEAA